MKGFILAAGIGSRLKPWTDHHPKALVPVGKVPVLKRVVEKMQRSGIDDITVNVHHFADQIKEFVKKQGWDIKISDESEELLETGGALLKAAEYLSGFEPILVHNADILSNADFGKMEAIHKNGDSKVTLLVSDRESSRKLIFDEDMKLKGWRNMTTRQLRPESVDINSSKDKLLAFSGIYIISPQLIKDMKKRRWEGKFSIIDYLLSTMDSENYSGYQQTEKLNLIDIGKPDSLNRANELYSNNSDAQN